MTGAAGNRSGGCSVCWFGGEPGPAGSGVCISSCFAADRSAASVPPAPANRPVPTELRRVARSGPVVGSQRQTTAPMSLQYLLHDFMACFRLVMAPGRLLFAAGCAHRPAHNPKSPPNHRPWWQPNNRLTFSVGPAVDRASAAGASAVPPSPGSRRGAVRVETEPYDDGAATHGPKGG